MRGKPKRAALFPLFSLEVKAFGVDNTAMSEKLNRRQIAIIRYALGAGQGSPLYRNHYAASPGCCDHSAILKLIELGRMALISGSTTGMEYFRVTPLGVDAIKETLKLSEYREAVFLAKKAAQKSGPRAEKN